MVACPVNSNERSVRLVTVGFARVVWVRGAQCGAGALLNRAVSSSLLTSVGLSVA